MRDRLKELYYEAKCKYMENKMSNKNIGSKTDFIIDNLIENGIICLPCKVGDTVYVLEDWGYKRELKTKEIGVIVIKGTNDFSKVFWEDVYGGEIGTFADIGKTVFLTKEEAEEHLQKGTN